MYFKVEFLNEEGTGLGPTLEFYALVAAKLQQKQIKMWIFDDKENTQVIFDFFFSKPTVKNCYTANI